MVRVLPQDLAEIAEKELNEKQSQTKDDLQHLKEWISKQNHLKARNDDQWLLAMLRGCKFSLERVKQKLDLYYTLRTTAPDITLRLKPTDPKFLEFFKLGTCVVLPKPKDKLFPRIVLIRAGRFDCNTNNVADVMCMLYYLIQILIVEDDVASVMGIKILVDYEGVTLSHLAQASPIMLKKIFAVYQDSMPLRLRGSHHMNLPTGIEKIFTLISGLLNEKARERLKIHKSCEAVTEHIPKEIIPKDYNGDGQSVSSLIDFWVSKFIEYRAWMRDEESFGTDESKRLGEPATKDLTGLDGSFRKLDID